MPLSVKRITLWRADVQNQAGVLARVLEPLAAAGADLRVVMGYRFPTAPEHSAVELYPVSGRRATALAGGVLSAATVTETLLVLLAVFRSISSSFSRNTMLVRVLPTVSLLTRAVMVSLALAPSGRSIRYQGALPPESPSPDPGR